MKKVLMTVFMVSLLPMINEVSRGFSVCYAEEKDNYRIPDMPNVTPVQSSYYDYAQNMLYIYGSLDSAVVSVKVTYNGRIVLSDIVMAEDLPVKYDFSGSESGTYQVYISSGSSVLKTFNFVR